jgi:hypothetical protein
VQAALPIGAGVDATDFDNGQAFASCGDGTLTVVGEKSGQWSVEQTVKTVAGARTSGVDLLTNKIYLPTAEMEPATTGRPRPKPGTFMIVEVGRQ